MQQWHGTILKKEFFMQDLCVFCGNDVSDLGVQVCINCKNKMKAFNMGLFHSKRKCVKNGHWENGEFRCSVCGRLIALAYKTDKIHIWKVPVYKKYKVSKDNISFIGEKK